MVLALGDVERRGFPRSAVKALQALPLIESGIADQFGLTDARDRAGLRVARGRAASMSQTAAAMLAKAGRDAACLECGTHWPLSEDGGPEARRQRTQSRRPCTTIAPASMPASSASPAASA